jgi:stage II sporulation protein M
MNNKLLKKFFQDIKNTLTVDKLKEYLKLPVYAYILSFLLGIIITAGIYFFNSSERGVPLTPQAFGLSTSHEWSYIIQNNIKVSITLFISGIVLYAGPLFFLGFNGLVHGILLVLSVQSGGVTGLEKYLILMGPHGIFEIPALLFSTGAGIVLSRELLTIINFRSFFINTNRLYEAFLLLVIAFFLFLIASVVETQVTFRILESYVSR